VVLAVFAVAKAPVASSFMTLAEAVVYSAAATTGATGATGA